MFVRANVVAAALFTFAAAVQVNDPDPVLWIAIYAAAAVVAGLAARRGAAPLLVAVCLGIAALVWGARVAASVPGVETYTSMFDAWEMRSLAVEQAREASGLFLVAAWMAALVIHHIRQLRHSNAHQWSPR